MLSSFLIVIKDYNILSLFNTFVNLDDISLKRKQKKQPLSKQLDYKNKFI